MMSVSDISPETAAREALAQRIARFVRALERVNRDPNRREAYHVIVALQHLSAGRYRDGDEAMMRAELVAPIPAPAAATLISNEPLTVDELRLALDEAVQRN